MKNPILKLITVLCASSVCLGGSIWAKKNVMVKDPYSDAVARQIGDILTIVIYENTDNKTKTERDMEKTTTRSQSYDGEVNIGGLIKNLPRFELGSGASDSSTFSGKAELEEQRTFKDKIPVVVIDVLANGNLVVSGSRSRDISGDVQTIDVTGIIRPTDIAYDNTVDSEKVADFRIVARTSGFDAPYTKPGWLGRIFDIIWPF